MGSKLSRRKFIQRTSAASALLFSQSVACRAEVNILDTKVLLGNGHYRGWPTITRRKNGELLAVCSGGRESHVCPFGRVEMQRSQDEGNSWSYPRTVMDGPIDDRDAGVLETATGSILITTFTSLAYEPILHKAQTAHSWSTEKIHKWQSVHRRLSEAERKKALNVWMIRSTDGGITFSARYPTPVSSPHGPIQLSDGRILYAGKELWQESDRIGVSVSEDDGQTWLWLATIPTRDGDTVQNYHELHAVEAANGKLIVQIRNHNKNNRGETLQSESEDGGNTWSTPRAIDVWGLPSHLLRMDDDQLLMTYGHRRQPLGNQARVSEDHGQTWSSPMILSGDGTSSDLGYPSTVQLTGGELLTLWYEKMAGSNQASLRQTRWRISS